MLRSIVTARVLGSVYVRDATTVIFFLAKALRQTDDSELARAIAYALARIGVATDAQAAILADTVRSG